MQLWNDVTENSAKSSMHYVSANEIISICYALPVIPNGQQADGLRTGTAMHHTATHHSTVHTTLQHTTHHSIQLRYNPLHSTPLHIAPLRTGTAMHITPHHSTPHHTIPFIRSAPHRSVHRSELFFVSVLIRRRYQFWLLQDGEGGAS